MITTDLNILRALIATALICIASSAHATGSLFRSYVSINGNDTNACTITAPCRLLPAALAQTQSGGEVWMLDSANYNTGVVNINRSVTILAVPGALGSIVGNNADAIDVSTANVSVTLRNLLIRNLAGAYNDGIRMSGAGDQLIVEGSQFNGLDEAIYLDAGGGSATVTNSTFRQNAYAVDIEGVSASSLATGVIDNCTIIGSGTAVQGVGAYAGSANLTISNTNISNLLDGIITEASSILLLDSNVVTKNYYGIYMYAGSAQSTGNNTFDNSINVQNGSIAKVSQY